MSYIAALAVISLIILIHEAGHFLAAKAGGIKIRVFSIGFGPAVLKKTFAETEFRLSLIPLGGYVLPDVADENDFFAISPARRILFSAGGPAANIVAAVIILAAVYTIRNGFSVAGSVAQPLAATASFFMSFFASLPAIFTAPEKLSGVIGIVSQGGTYIGADAVKILSFAAMMNLNLGMFNLLPFPVLDGGKILLYLIEKAVPKTVKIHVPVGIVSWVLLLGLTVYITVMDIIRLA